MRNNKKEA